MRGSHLLSVSLLALLSWLSAPAASAETIRVWHTESDPRTIDAFEKISSSFEEANPGVTVELVQIGWDDLYRKLTVAIQSGTAPDLTQIQPFMAAYLHHFDYLEPLDDVIETVGSDDIFPVVRDLQLFDGKRYGIATALGISYYSYRPHLVGAGQVPIDAPTWDDYLEFVRSAVGTQQPSNRAPVLLPANDLHITLLFTELLASNGGSLFDEDGQPDFNNPQVLETLRYWRDLFRLIPSEYRSSSYSENFTHYARGLSVSLPAFFGRGILAIERSAPEGERNPRSFSRLPHPVGPSGITAYATLDAEAWAILKGSPNPKLARDFIEFFYLPEQYLQFCASVPIHLTPILQSLARDEVYTSLPIVEKWKGYYDYQVKMLEEGTVLPIFMSKADDRLNPALFRLEGSRVVSTMVRDVTFDGRTPEEAVDRATARASELTEGLISDDKEPAGATADRTPYSLWITLIVAFVAVVLLFWIYRVWQR